MFAVVTTEEDQHPSSQAPQTTLPRRLVCRLWRGKDKGPKFMLRGVRDTATHGPTHRRKDAACRNQPISSDRVLTSRHFCQSASSHFVSFPRQLPLCPSPPAPSSSPALVIGLASPFSGSSTRHSQRSRFYISTAAVIFT